MPESWYESAKQDEPLLQGDIIPDCPLLAWKQDKPEFYGINEEEVLSGSWETIKQDVVIMTQACDLENKKVTEVVVCPVYKLTDIKSSWEQTQKDRGQVPTTKNWKSFCNDLRDGFQWNYAMLNKGSVDGLTTEHRVVDFHEIYTLPLNFCTELAKRRGLRLRLRPPYREHLSQAFARYFMRVGQSWPHETGQGDE